MVRSAEELKARGPYENPFSKPGHDIKAELIDVAHGASSKGEEWAIDKEVGELEAQLYRDIVGG